MNKFKHLQHQSEHALRFIKPSIFILGIGIFGNANAYTGLPSGIDISTTQENRVIWFREDGANQNNLASIKSGSETAKNNITIGDCNHWDCVQANGFQQADGSSNANLHVGFANPGDKQSYAWMSNTHSITITNNTANSTVISFDYQLNNMSYDINWRGKFDGNPYSDPNSKSTGLQFFYQLQLLGSAGFNEQSQYTAWGGRQKVGDDYFINKDTDYSGKVFSLKNTVPEYNYSKEYIGEKGFLNDYADSAFLGSFAPGESKTLEVFMAVGVRGFESEWEADINFGDPNGLSNASSFSFTSNPVSAVPEPSTYALMLGGLGLVGVMAARRKKQNAW